MEVDLRKYQKFVDSVTSKQSTQFPLYIDELKKLQEHGCKIARLDTAVCGLSSEAGEAMEIVKKMKFQGKEWNDDNRFHLIREAGDIIFYWINLCMALEVSPGDVIAENVEKLKARYPGGEFNVWHSENRKENDL